MAQSIADKIAAEYDNQRSRETIARNSRVEQIHEKFPELKKIHSDIASAGYNHAMELSKNPEKEDEIRERMNMAINELNLRREQILKENNIPSDYDKIHYQCALCNDTGYIENEKCHCHKAKLTKYTYERSNLSRHMREISFDKFDFKYFSDEPQEDGISPLMRIKKAYGEAVAMSRNFDEYSKSFLFFGAPGSGKTFLSGCIATALIEQGYAVLYVTAGKLFELMENKKYSRPREESDDELIETAYSCDLLILDDLGAESPSKLAPSFVYDILNERLMSERKMIINTNLNLNQLSKAYTQRFVSRLFEHFYALRFVSEDIRKQKMYE